VQANDPERFKQIAQAWAEADAGIRTYLQARAYEATQYREQVQGQFNAYAAQEDYLFNQAHPELKDPAVKAKVMNAAMDYLRSTGMSDREIAAAWNGQGATNLRDHRTQSALLKLARQHLAEKKAAKTTPPRKNTPIKTVRPGSAGEVRRATEGRHAELEARLDRSHSLRDAARLVAQRRADARRWR
jgi:hypothetical protein